MVVDDGTPAIAEEDDEKREVTTMTTKGDGNYLREMMRRGFLLPGDWGWSHQPTWLALTSQHFVVRVVIFPGI